MCILLLTATVGSVFQTFSVRAAQITTRSLTLQAGATDGGSKPGGVVNHLFTFTVPTTGDVGSIQFLYCTTASGDCTTPTGLSTTSATIGTQSGATGFTNITNTTNGAPYIARVAASGVTADTVVSYQLRGITNPTTTNQAFYVRMSTFASLDATGTAIDAGTVAASTATQIELTGTMPESLIFCTGETIGTTNSVPDCSKASLGIVSFNQLFSPTDTATATSQMAASTNATGGYTISVYGPTLTSGSNTITPMTTGGGGTRGTSQFGMNLKANTNLTSTELLGTEITPVSDGDELKGQARPGYDTVDSFKFDVNGNNIADSANGGAGATNAQIYTSSYIVNVSGSQTAGTYTTTLTYICTATF